MLLVHEIQLTERCYHCHISITVPQHLKKGKLMLLVFSHHFARFNAADAKWNQRYPYLTFCLRPFTFSLPPDRTTFTLSVRLSKQKRSQMKKKRRNKIRANRNEASFLSFSLQQSMAVHFTTYWLRLGVFFSRESYSWRTERPYGHCSFITINPTKRFVGSACQGIPSRRGLIVHGCFHPFIDFTVLLQQPWQRGIHFCHVFSHFGIDSHKK